MTLRRVIALLLTLLALPVAAEIYQWRDAQGRLHFGDKPDRRIDASPVTLEPLNTMTPVEPLRARPAASDDRRSIVPPRLEPGFVVLYSTPTCGFCYQAREYMNRNGIPYREKDITASRASREEFVAYGGRGVPLLFIGTLRGTRKMRGFSESRFAALYETP